ncbi:MBL fold metallo-hydrolase [Neolewinella persica]|uniref:MBL fold metallo-hydrolase n=1 Tax=Neolewinella persica TaxID=70998 RepID=UPI00037CA046|nr:MBL fold metallo-hydrolase [Neolewinella persica]
MKVQQIYTGCLAEAAYYIESKGEAVIIDPLRETAPYLEMVEQDGAKIKYVLETHFHADFVSGHLDLARKTGAQIVYGPTANPNFEAYIAKDMEILQVGDVTIQVLHTPGHTMESSTYLLRDEQGKDYALFTGDTLFLGDVGRPDLAIKQGEITEEDLAGFLFDSLRNKIMPLADDVIVYPGHGAGSACGKKMSNDTEGTLGEQKQSNYALRADMTREEFVKEVLTGLVAPPQYFPKNAMMNKMGYESFDKVRIQGTQALTVRAFKAAWAEEEALVIDARSKEDFAKGFLPGSIFIGLDGTFAPWVGLLVPDLQQPILFLADEGDEEEVVTRLARVGYDNAIGYLQGGFDAWKEAGEDIDIIQQVSAEQFAERVTESTSLLDVRKSSEYSSEHVIGARNFPLDTINKTMSELNPAEQYFLHCASGYRSMITASILRARGFQHLVDIQGGFDALKETSMKVTDYVEQTTEL